jgi:hypothetical protein
MTAIGGIGGVGGSSGGSGGASGGAIGATAGPSISDAATSGAYSWFSASHVMNTTGKVEGSHVSLKDGDLHGGIGQFEQQRHACPPPHHVHAPEGVGSAPSKHVVSQVAAAYAANQLR